MALRSDIHTPLSPQEDSLRLTGRRLPRWAPGIAMVVGVAVGLLVQLTGVTFVGLAPVVMAVIVFLITYTGWTLAVEGRRHATDRFATALIYSAATLALVPLIWILVTVVVQGITVLSPQFLFADTMRYVNPRAAGGGVAHAVVGTIQQVGIATLISVPIGLLTAIYLSEYGRGRLARSINFFVDVMTGIPSIVAGMFIYTFWILTLGFPQSGLAAGLALTILMVPVVVRSAEEMLRIVPTELREGLQQLVDDGADAIIQFGANLPMGRFAGVAEQWLERPVICVNVATYWHALRVNGITDHVGGYGGLMERH